MVAPAGSTDEPTRRPDPLSSTPLLWRVCAKVARGLVRALGRVEITGEFPEHLRGRPVLVTLNHIGMFDPFVMIAAFDKAGLPPRFLLTAGLVDAPVLGTILRRSGHLRVDRGKANVAEVFQRAVAALDDGGGPLLLYPEGRISREPGLWPERGKTGAARMALAGRVPVVTVSQWGAHEAVYWGTEHGVERPADLKPLLVSVARSILSPRVFRVHFGGEVDLSDLKAEQPGDARRAHERIMRAITADLVALRPHEPDGPRFLDPTRPTDSTSPWRPRPDQA